MDGKANAVIQDVFGDYICGVVSGMHEYWTQFGFMDKIDDRRAAMDVLDIVKTLATVEVIEIPEEQQTELEIAMDEEYIIVLS